MAYYKVRIEGWCDWDPTGAALADITRQMACHDKAICTLQEVVETVDRPQDIEDDTAMSFFGGEKGDAERSSG
jgi:hypothetical protein